jgi:hypothetical protein
MSTLRFFHGRSDGSLIAVTLNLLLLTLMVPFDPYFAGEAAVHGIVMQKVRVGLDRSEVIDRNDPDILAVSSAMDRRILRLMRPNPLMAT